MERVASCAAVLLDLSIAGFQPPSGPQAFVERVKPQNLLVGIFIRLKKNAR